jgi:hypothetical protein
MKPASSADQVRQYSVRHYIEPARARGDSSVRIVAGDVHKAIHLSNRVPLVCQALKSRKFVEENGLVLEKLEGPPSGLGTRATFIYRFANLREARSTKDEWPFLRLRGIAKNLFGPEGGEEFLRKEREQFYGSGGEQGIKT